jgi:prepilin-type N-terminal cleavage/methylation domain-containing protein
MSGPGTVHPNRAEGRVRRIERKDGAGFTLIETLMALVLLGSLVALSVPALVRLREAWMLDGAARAAQRHLHAARRLAVTRRDVVRVRATPEAILLTGGTQDSVLVRLPMGPGTELPVDSVRLRPSTLRFNARGHAAPGSLTLYRRGRRLRLVSNFLGRVRRERPTG